MAMQRRPLTRALCALRRAPALGALLLVACNGPDSTHLTRVDVEDTSLGVAPPVDATEEPSDSASEPGSEGRANAEPPLPSNPPPPERPPPDRPMTLAPVALDAGPGDGGLEVDPPVVAYPADWCAAFGADLDERLDSAYAIVEPYIVLASTECSTLALVEPLEPFAGPAFFAFVDYLLEFTNALFGCAPLFTAPEGGIAVFGLANTSAVGVAPPPFGEDDVEVLLDMFRQSLQAAALLGAAEEQALLDHLRALGRASATPGVVSGLSTCAPAGD